MMEIDTLQETLHGQLKSGAIPLFKNHYYPWGPLPYPVWHAKYALELFEKGEIKAAERAASWQSNTLDHFGNPLFSFFLQEGGCSYKSLKENNLKLFEKFPLSSLEGSFYDEDLGFALKRTKNSTVLSHGSGCKSGLGVYLSHDVGIVNYGPSLLPVGDCEGFGISGRAIKKSYQQTRDGFRFSFLNRISSPHPRKHILEGVKDSGSSYLWIEAESELIENVLYVHSHLEGFTSLEKATFNFFGKGSSCIVASSHKLRPHSLDRYLGPPDMVEFRGDQGKILLECTKGASKMEVIPLAGGDAFWGADFLVAYFFDAPYQSFSIN